MITISQQTNQNGIICLHPLFLFPQPFLHLICHLGENCKTDTYACFQTNEWSVCNLHNLSFRNMDNIPPCLMLIPPHLHPQSRKLVRTLLLRAKATHNIVLLLALGGSKWDSLPWPESPRTTSSAVNAFLCRVHILCVLIFTMNPAKIYLNSHQIKPDSQDDHSDMSYL